MCPHNTLQDHPPINTLQLKTTKNLVALIAKFIKNRATISYFTIKIKSFQEKPETYVVIFEFLLVKLYVCLLSIFNAFLPNSKANPNVKAKKNISIITKPYIPFV